MKDIFKNENLYKIAKDRADKLYDKHSAYKSGYIVKAYKELGGKFKMYKKNNSLKSWFDKE